MKKIILLDYLGTCDEKENPIGHTVKVLNEYSRMLSSDYEVTVGTAKSTHNKIQNPNKLYAPYAINLGVSGKKEKIKNIIKRLKNIFYLVNQSKGYPIWICSSDFYIFLYLFFKPKRKDKVVITLYRRNFDGEKFSKVKNYIFKKAIKKTDLVVCSDEQTECFGTPVFHMPDYLYQDEAYGKYWQGEKEDKVVCLGTMGRNKLLPELVDAFNHNGYPLVIKGKFSDEELYKELLGKAKENISIENCYISDDEYLQILASAKYSVLPYDMKMSKDRTSGVILESIFVNTIPIADKRLLDFMKIPGIAYEEMEELKEVDFLNNHLGNQYGEFIRENYSYDEMKKKLVKAFEGV